MKRDRLTDAGPALAVYALSLPLLAAGDGERAGLGAILAALASLPPAARRHSPLVVFAVTGIASVALRAVGLTPREREVLDLVARGLSEEIADALVIEESTVNSHTKRILGLRDRVHVVIYAYQHGLAGTP